MTSKVCAIATLAVLWCAPGRAHAEDQNAKRSPQRLQWSYLYDGGAIGFVYGAGALGLALTLEREPRQTPLFFSSSEGGAAYRGDTVPGWTLAVGGAATLLGIASTPSDARWFHAKGHAQTWATASAITQGFKLGFGRHRPDFDPTGVNPDSSRRSFISGHSSQTLMHTTYAALYLRYHGFAKVRGDRAMPWFEALSYAGLGAISFYVPYSRVQDNRHHKSDVIAGSVVGAATAVGFFAWQEHRYRQAVSPLGEDAPSWAAQLMIVPDVKNRGVIAVVPW